MITIITLSSDPHGHRPIPLIDVTPLHHQAVTAVLRFCHFVTNNYTQFQNTVRPYILISVPNLDGEWGVREAEPDGTTSSYYCCCFSLSWLA